MLKLDSQVIGAEACAGDGSTSSPPMLKALWSQQVIMYNTGSTKQYCVCAVFLNPVIFHLTAVQSLQQVFYQRNLPFWLAGTIVAAIMLPLVQIRDIGDVAIISVAGWYLTAHCSGQ